MTEERKYIYSIIRNPKDGSASSPQETQASDNFHLSGVGLGIDNRDIILVPYGDIAAAVSNAHVINFDKLDNNELTRLIAVHDQVNCGLMKKYDVIPMRFGMIAENTEAIRSILTKAYIQFKTVLEKIAGKAEFIVQVFWNEKNMLEKIVQENAEIKKLKDEAEAKGKILGFASKIKLGKRLAETLESHRKEYIKDILDSLKGYFSDFISGKLFDPVQMGIKETGKEMIMTYSFLVGKTEESVLESQLNKLAEKYKDELRFKYIGPMAPYSFAVINLSVGNFDFVDTARKTLGLGESATLPEIRDAYYKLAGEYHPDKHEYKKDQALLEQAAVKMKDLVVANEILTVYGKHYLSSLLALGKEQICSFKKEDVERVILVNVNT